MRKLLLFSLIFVSGISLYGQTSKSTIKNWFQTGLKPTQVQFQTLIDNSYNEVTSSILMGSNFPTISYQPYTSPGSGRIYNGSYDPTNSLRMNYDGYWYSTKLFSNGITLSKGSSNNKIVIDTVNSIRLYGLSTVYNIISPNLILLPTGGSGPDITVYNGGNLRSYEFVTSTLKELNMMFTLPNSYKEGSNITIRLHLYNNATNSSGAVLFKSRYVWSNINTSSVTETTISNTITIIVGSNNSNTVIDFPVITGTGKTIGSVVSCNIYRDPTDVIDTYIPSVWLKGIEIIYEIDALGSNTSSSKN